MLLITAMSLGIAGVSTGALAWSSVVDDTEEAVHKSGAQMITLGVAGLALWYVWQTMPPSGPSALQVT